MIDSAAFESAQRALPAHYEPPSISSIGIITADRAKHFKRCAGSWARHLRLHERRCEIAVMDDSASASARDSCRNWLRSVAQCVRVPIFYAGHEEKREFISRLEAEGIHPELTQFALTNTLNIPSSPGANRNALLLHTAGTATISCDDDVVCRVYDLRRGGQFVNAVSFADTAERIRFVQAGRRVTAEVPEFGGDLITVHESLLGQPLRQLVFPFRNTMRVSAAQMGGRLTCDLLEGNGAAALTISGVLGDSGLPHLAPLMIATGQARERFLRAWDALGEVRMNNHVILGVPRPTLSVRGPVATTTATGFDNRTMLPPFLPSGRGEDTLFGVMLAKCFPSAYIGYVPVGLPHDLERQREYGPLPTAFRLSNLLSTLISGAPDLAITCTDARMRAVGRHLIECGTAPISDFTAHVLRCARTSLVGSIEICTRLLETYAGVPACWAEELAAWRARLEQTLLAPDAGLPVDVFHAPPIEERYQSLQGFVLKLGDLLQHWPDIVAATSRLKAAGYTLAKRVA